MELLCLPADPMLHLFSFLNFKDLSRCALTCHHLYELSVYDRLWKRHCSVCWDVTVCPDDMKWRENFRDLYRSFGRYLTIYRPISQAWKQIEVYLKEHCPGIYESLQDGILDEDIDELEDQLGVKFPADLRCVHRIHNGQRLQDARRQTVYGLLGTVKFSRFFASEMLLPLNHAQVLRRPDLPCPCVSTIACPRSRVRVYLTTDEPLPTDPPGSLFYAFSSDGHSAGVLRAETPCDLFVKSNSFFEFFVAYAQKLSAEQYPSVNGEILRFEHDKQSEAVTEHICISVATAFMPMMSRTDPAEFVFAYRITLSMASDVHPRYACQLETRQWFITDETGNVETVKGPGVVGEYPVVKPGSNYSYISCTSFKTKRGTMHGTYTMRNLATGETIDAVVPLFHMECPAFLSLTGE